MSDVSLTVDDLIGYQRAEYAKATRNKTLLLVAQFAVALPPAASIFFDNSVVLYYLAIAGFILLLLWLWFDSSYEKCRAAAEGARRASLVIGGLGQPLSPDTDLMLRASFTVTDEEAVRESQVGYYASDAAPGPRRLGEMVEESAFWTADLQSGSGKFMWLTFGGLVALLLISLVFVLPFTTTESLMVVARMFLTVLVFLLSADVWRTAMGHLRGARGTREIRHRLASLAERGYPEGDVLLAMADYNAAVEAAPMIIPWVYDSRREELAKRWDAYARARKAGAPEEGPKRVT